MKNHGKAHGQYENEVEKPHVPKHGHQMSGMGLDSFKGEADPIAYGQAGSQYKEDNRKIEAQFKHYHWEGASEH